MITFKINDIDISNDVLLNTFNYMQRIDDVFGTGSFQFESKTIDYNIPPYSILQIDDNYYCCSSEATYHYGRKSWFHNVSIIEATALLSRLLVGSKAFSITGTKTYDWDKLDILTKLINQKYLYLVNITIQGSSSDFNKQIEYVFTAGTTLFDALTEIGKQYNIRFYVASINKYNILIKYQKLEDLKRIEWEEERIISKTKIQNPENYCKYLETEATNVIDTNQTTVVKNIFPTANDIKLSEDTFVIQTPTPIYKLVSFKTKMGGYLQTRIDTGSLWAGTSGSIVKTYEEWTAIHPKFKDIYNKYYAELFEWDYFKTRLWTGSYTSYWPAPVSDNGQNAEHIPNVVTDVDFTSNILSKEQYDLVEDKDKPDYAYYTIGSNTLDGFNIFYKNDFWNTLIGQSKKPFLLRTQFNDNKYQGVYFEGNNVTTEYIKITKWNATYTHKLFETPYEIEYYPIANPYIVDTKKDIPLNETSYKNYSLSYNKSSNYVDFDKMITSMQIVNNSSGKVELVIEYDTTTAPFGFTLMRKVIIDEKEWYIISSETTYRNGQQISRFNLVSEFNKIADSISLNSQYNTLKNPLENIIERPIFYEVDNNVTITKGTTYAKFRFYSYNDQKTKYLYMPIVIFNQDNETYIYVEMQDQYSASKRPIYVENNVFKVEDVPYVDSNNEITNFSMWLVDLKELSLDDIKKLPETPSKVSNQVALVNDKWLYKDAREKLTFTIKANNCIIK